MALASTLCTPNEGARARCERAPLTPRHGRIGRGRELKSSLQCRIEGSIGTKVNGTHLLLLLHPLPLSPVTSSNRSTSPTGPALKSEGGKEREEEFNNS